MQQTSKTLKKTRRHKRAQIAREFARILEWDFSGTDNEPGSIDLLLYLAEVALRIAEE